MHAVLAELLGDAFIESDTVKGMALVGARLMLRGPVLGGHKITCKFFDLLLIDCIFPMFGTLAKACNLSLLTQLCPAVHAILVELLEDACIEGITVEGVAFMGCKRTSKGMSEGGMTALLERACMCETAARRHHRWCISQAAGSI